MHVYDAFHAESELIPVARLNGITNAIVAPQSQDTLPGQDSFIQLDGKSANDMLLVRDIAMPLNFTGEQRRNESWEKRKFPQTRMGLAAQLRQAFMDAQDYSQRLGRLRKEEVRCGRKARRQEGPAIAAQARSETGSLAALSSGQEGHRAGGAGTQRSGNRGRTGPAIQPEIRAQPHQPLAVCARLCGQSESPRDRGARSTKTPRTMNATMRCTNCLASCTSAE